MADATAPVVTAYQKDTCYAMYREEGVAANSAIYAGIGLAFNASGFLVPASTAGALSSAGRAAQTVTGTSVAGAVTCRVDQGAFVWAAGTNPPLQANINQLCYWQDDQTVTMTPGTLVAGTVFDVDASGVWVLIGAGLQGGSVATGKKYLTLNLADVKSADASVYYLASPVAGKITNLLTALSAALATGNSTATVSIGGVNVTGGVVTMVQAASAAGQVNTAAPTALNTLAVGSSIAVTIGGTNTATAGATLTIEVSTSA